MSVADRLDTVGLLPKLNFKLKYIIINIIVVTKVV